MDSLSYQRHREKARQRSQRIVVSGQDIGPIPSCKNIVRRIRAERAFRFFCEAYFPHLFNLAWSADHLKVIELIERTVLNGEMFAVAMPRASGKTTLCEAAVIWAVLIGRHQFVYLIAATDEHASQFMANVKAHLTTNQYLLEDFPDAILPFRNLEGESRKANGQRYYGVRTHIRWDEDKIVFATIPRCRCSGAIIKCTSIGSAIRGAKVVRPSDGVSLRPTLAIIDDPQTNKSAKSPMQVRERLSAINGAIAGLPGPGHKIGIIVPCTVIAANDVADQLLNRDKNPLWKGIRTKLVYEFPKNEKLWAEYRRIRDDSFRNGGDGKEATTFYIDHRTMMDDGASLSWPARFNHDEVSGVQYAMNLRFKDEATFFAEYQNDPLSDRPFEEDLLTADEIAEKTNGLKRRVVPLNCNTVTAFIDVQQKALFYTVLAFDDQFGGAVIDYGTYPDQHRPYFTLSNITETIQAKHPVGGIEAALTAALDALETDLMNREWEREDGTPLRIDRLLKDSGWGEHTELVYEHCRRSPHAANVRPSKGRSVTSSSKPIDEWEKVTGMKCGPGWAERPIPNLQRVRLIHYDTNRWKSFAQARLSTPKGDPSALTLWGRDPDPHMLFCEHLTAEYRDRKSSERTGRTVDEWHLPPSKPDNHWLDCLVGCCVAASFEGIKLGSLKTVTKSTERRSLAEMAKAARR